MPAKPKPKPKPKPRRPPLVAAPVRKDDGENLPMAVFDRNGKLVGIVMDPSKIQRVAGVEVAPDLEPVPSAEVGIPADAVPEDDAVAKQRAEIKKSVYTDPDPREQNKTAEALNAAAIRAFREIRQRPIPVTRDTIR